MEFSPSSTRKRTTRSQTKSSLHHISSGNNNVEETAPKTSTKNQERGALADISNDSPIVGLASGNLNETPLSKSSKQRSFRYKSTPGSGEALLRGQVKSLLQKVEEEAEISKFLSLDSGPRHGLRAAFLCSPAGLLAPTPANTPVVLNFNVVEDDDEESGVEASPIEDQLTVSKVLSGISDGINKQQQESIIEAEKDVISRSLLLDFSDRSDCSSVLTQEEDDDSSIWSLQVNASTRDEDEDEDAEEDLEKASAAVDDDYFGEDGTEEAELDSDALLDIDELCRGILSISVNGVAFRGKHTRYVYNSDDELVEIEEESGLRLKGLPTPKGKHLRFLDEQE